MREQNAPHSHAPHSQMITSASIHGVSLTE